MVSNNNNNTQQNTNGNNKENINPKQQNGAPIRDISSEFPEIDFGVTTHGLSVSCPKLLKAPKFVAWDNKTVSKFVDIDYIIETDSMTIFSNRFKKGKVVKFDLPIHLRKYGAIRVCGNTMRNNVPDLPAADRQMEDTMVIQNDVTKNQKN